MPIGIRATRDHGDASSSENAGRLLSLSSDVLPQIKEFDRVSTTVVNAYVGPALSRYLRGWSTRLGDAGYTGPS